VQDKHYSSIDELIEEIRGIPIEELREYREDGKYLISVDELRAAGALDVPAAWRKSLGVERNQQFSLFGEDDDTLPEQQDPTAGDPSVDESADELP
jgi:hypothetical protein